MPTPQYDIFISYRQNDNHSGWVTGFVNDLEEELRAAIKEPVSVYFDENPHDGLQEHHEVDDSLREKLKCRIFIPIISRTYCDQKSFAWKNEFLVFLEHVQNDSFGPKVKLKGGNTASRILPLRIHELDREDIQLFESKTGGVMRSIDFVFNSSGVNRPLKREDRREDNQSKTQYIDQVNKVANAIREILAALNEQKEGNREPGRAGEDTPLQSEYAGDATNKWKKSLIPIAMVVLLSIAGLFWYFSGNESIPGLKAGESSLAIIPFRNISGEQEYDHLGLGFATEVRGKLVSAQKFRLIISEQSTLAYRDSGTRPEVIGDELNITHIISGSYQFSGGEIRVNVELVDAANGNILWSLPYTGKYEGIFDMQNSIAAMVLEKFNEKQTREMSSSTVNLKSFEHYFNGNLINYKNAGSITSLEAAEEYKEAIRLDSGNVAAWAGLFYVYNGFHWNYPEEDRVTEEMIREIASYTINNFPESNDALLVKASLETDRQKRKVLIEEVLKKDNQCESCYRQLFFNEYIGNDNFSRAFEYIKKASELNPSNAGNWLGMARLFSRNGDYENAHKAYLRGLEINPEDYLINRDLRSLKQDLFEEVHLPEQTRKIYGKSYIFDSLLFLNNREVIRGYLDTVSADASLTPAGLYFEKSKAFQVLDIPDSMRYYGEKYLSVTDPDIHLAQIRVPEIYMFLGRMEAEIEERVFSRGIEKYSLTYFRFFAEYHLINGQYEKGTALLKELNAKYPQYGGFAFLNNPLLRKARREYPPLEKAIQELKIPQKISEMELVEW